MNWKRSAFNWKCDFDNVVYKNVVFKGRVAKENKLLALTPIKNIII